MSSGIVEYEIMCAIAMSIIEAIKASDLRLVSENIIKRDRYHPYTMPFDRDMHCIVVGGQHRRQVWVYVQSDRVTIEESVRNIQELLIADPDCSPAYVVDLISSLLSN